MVKNFVKVKFHWLPPERSAGVGGRDSDHGISDREGAEESCGQEDTQVEVEGG